MSKKLEKELAEAKGTTAALTEAIEREVQAAAAAADPPTDVEVGFDFDYQKYDPNDPEMLLKRANLPYEPEKYGYRIVSSRPEMMDKRKAMGYEMLPVSTRGSVLARIPLERKARLDARIKERKEMMESANTARLEREIKNAGGIPEG